MNFLIVGYGFVGKATEHLFKMTNSVRGSHRIDIHDPPQGLYASKDRYDYVVVCVPTPLVGDTLDVSLLKEVCDEHKSKGPIVIRSTIGPDHVEQYFSDAIIMPEFLRERCWKADVEDKKLPLIIGTKKQTRLFSLLSAVKNPWVMSPREAAAFKLFRNSALAMRVALANTYYEICESFRLDSDMLLNALHQDDWVGGTHWEVPGPDGQFGFGGTCLPKDLTHTASLCDNADNILSYALSYNETRRNK